MRVQFPQPNMEDAHRITEEIVQKSIAKETGVALDSVKVKAFSVEGNEKVFCSPCQRESFNMVA